LCELKNSHGNSTKNKEAAARQSINENERRERHDHVDDVLNRCGEKSIVPRETCHLYHC
jgi:hypothetical protein